jgi:hypothetical protein
MLVSLIEVHSCGDQNLKARERSDIFNLGDPRGICKAGRQHARAPFSPESVTSMIAVVKDKRIRSMASLVCKQQVAKDFMLTLGCVSATCAIPLTLQLKRLRVCSLSPPYLEIRYPISDETHVNS